VPPPLPARAALWAVIALGASAGAPLLGRPFESESRSALAFTPETFDFGTVRAGTPARAEYAFVNATEAPVRILSAHGTCGCVTVEASGSYVEPGGRGVIRATLDTEGRQGPQTLRVRVRTDEGDARLTLKGEIRVALRPRPPRWILKAVEPGSEHRAEIRVEKLEPVREVAFECVGDGLSAERIAEDASALTLRVTVKVPWTRGRQQSGLRLTGGEGATWVPVAWIVPPPFELSAQEIEIKAGRGELTARPRWPSVSLAGIDTHGLPLAIARDGDAIRFTLEGSAFDIPSGATIDLVPEPKSLGKVTVPVYARFD